MLRLGLASPSSSPNTIASTHFAAAVKRRSNGRLTVEVYPSGQIASEQGIIDAVASGVVDFTVDASTTLVPLFPQFQLFDLPFLFRDGSAAYRILDGPIGDEFYAPLAAKGLVGLGWGNGGFKQIETVSRSILTPEDMKGLRIRIVGGVVNVATYQALGAVPVTIDLTEAYTALSQHTIEAVDVPLASFTDNKFFTIAKHVAMTNHVFAVTPFVGSKRKIDALPLPLQKIVKEEGRAMMPFWRSLIAQQTAEKIQILKNSGVAFTEIQYPAFRKAVDSVYAGVQAKVGGDLLERMNRAASATAGSQR
jgi:TRAP-type transport system periplasmic protein